MNLIFKRCIETPLNVGLALDVHEITRSKSLVETLGQLDIIEKGCGDRDSYCKFCSWEDEVDGRG